MSTSMSSARARVRRGGASMRPSRGRRTRGDRVDSAGTWARDGGERVRPATAARRWRTRSSRGRSCDGARRNRADRIRRRACWCTASCSRRNLQSFAKKLAEKFRFVAVFTVDLRNHGESNAFDAANKPTGTNTVENAARDVLSVLNHLKIYPYTPSDASPVRWR